MLFRSLLLADIKAAFDEKGVDRFSSEDLCRALNAIEGRPWADWKKVGLTRNSLARLLKDFKIRPQTLRFDARTAKGYSRLQFSAAWETYVSPPGDKPSHRNNPDTIGVFETSQPSRASHGVTVGNVENLANYVPCYDVSVEGAEGGRNELCDHCSLPGDEASDPLLDVAMGGTGYRLHRGCLESWEQCNTAQSSI